MMLVCKDGMFAMFLVFSELQMILAAEERRTHSEAELDTWHIGLRKDISSCEV